MVVDGGEVLDYTSLIFKKNLTLQYWFSYVLIKWQSRYFGWRPEDGCWNHWRKLLPLQILSFEGCLCPWLRPNWEENELESWCVHSNIWCCWGKKTYLIVVMPNWATGWLQSKSCWIQIFPLYTKIITRFFETLFSIPSPVISYFTEETLILISFLTVPGWVREISFNHI